MNTLGKSTFFGSAIGLTGSTLLAEDYSKHYNDDPGFHNDTIPIIVVPMPIGAIVRFTLGVGKVIVDSIVDYLEGNIISDNISRPH